MQYKLLKEMESLAMDLEIAQWHDDDGFLRGKGPQPSYSLRRPATGADHVVRSARFTRSGSRKVRSSPMSTRYVVAGGCLLRRGSSRAI